MVRRVSRTLSGDTTAIKASVRRPAGESRRVLVRVVDVGGGDGSAHQPDQGRDQAVRVGTGGQSVPSRRAVQPVAPVSARQRLQPRVCGLARQLITVDPSNPDNYQLIAIGFAGHASRIRHARLKDAEAKAKVYGQRANTSKVAAVLKANIDSAARINPVIKAYGDSDAGRPSIPRSSTRAS